jgi:hypothetical protein
VFLTDKIMANRKKTYKFLVGKEMPYTIWGRKGCSHGMYSNGGYNNYFYGVKGIFGLNIFEGWGYYRPK